MTDSEAKSRQVFSALNLFLLFFITNAFIAAYRWMPEPSVLTVLAPTLEASLAFFLLMLTVRFRPKSRLILYVLSFVLGFLIMYSLAEGFFRYFYSRPFEPWTDIPHVRSGLLLLFGRIEELLGLFTVFTIILILALGFLTARLFIGWSLTAAKRSGRPNVAALAAVGLAVLSIIIAPEVRVLSGRIAEQIAPPVEAESEKPIRQDKPDATYSTVNMADTSHNSLPGLYGADVYLFFVESYGRTAFVQPEITEKIFPFLKRQEASLEESGYHIASDYLLSPVVGGYSWIAETAFLTGIDISNQSEYDEVMKSEVDTLSGIMREEGYLTILSMPGTIHGEWPEAKSFYRFEETILGDDFTYEGPMFSFVPVPDQIAVFQSYQFLSALRSDGVTRPAFTEHVLVSSHTPYNRIPPYIPQWDILEDGSIYHELEISTFDNSWLSGSEFIPGYISAMSYTLTVLTEFLSRVVKEDVLAIIVGDHQPGPQVRHEGATFAVPIHIVAYDRRTTDAFINLGYVEGIIPSQEPPYKKSHTFFEQFLSVARAKSISDNQ